MITIATLSDEIVAGQRRAAGRQMRKIVALAVDSYNIVLAEATDDPTKLMGKKFVGKLAHLVPILKEWELDVEHARKQLLSFFARFTGTVVGDLSFAEMDKQFAVSKRRDDASAILLLYDQLKEKGWADSSNEEEN